jgi:hypothetical protein
MAVVACVLDGNVVEAANTFSMASFVKGKGNKSNTTVDTTADSSMTMLFSGCLFFVFIDNKTIIRVII